MTHEEDLALLSVGLAAELQSMLLSLAVSRLAARGFATQGPTESVLRLTAVRLAATALFISTTAAVDDEPHAALDEALEHDVPSMLADALSWDAPAARAANLMAEVTNFESPRINPLAN